MISWRLVLTVVSVMFLGIVLWMAYFFFFRTDGRGHVLREAESHAVEARGQRLLGRADAMLARGEFEPARTLLDSLRDADANPDVFIDTDALMQRYDSLRVQRYRAKTNR